MQMSSYVVKTTFILLGNGAQSWIDTDIFFLVKISSFVGYIQGIDWSCAYFHTSTIGFLLPGGRWVNGCVKDSS